MLASAQRSRQFDAHEDRLRTAVKAAVREVGANTIRWSHRYKALTGFGFSFMSWGEEMTIEIFEDGTVEVRSNSSMPLTLIDWGKNASNCKKILDAIEDDLERYPDGNEK